MRKLIPALGIAAFLTLGIALPAHAESITIVNYTVTAEDPVSVSWPSIGSHCTFWDNSARNYNEVAFRVSATGDYRFVDDHTTGDGRLAFLTDTYNPADISNCFDEVDEDGTVSLTAGTEYTMMRAGLDGARGDFRYSVTGPGILAIGPVAVTTTTVTATATSVVIGAPVELTATVAGASPAGTVEFFDGTASLGSAPVDAGTATLSVSTLTVGSHSITATYSGDLVNGTSTSDPYTVNVDAAAAAVTPAATLPDTGVETGPLALGALLLLLVGAITLWGARRQNA